MRWLLPFLLLGLAACGNLQSGAPGGVTLSVGIEEPRANSQTPSRTIAVRASATGASVERVDVEYQGQGVQDRIQMRSQEGKWVGELPLWLPLGTYTLKAVAFAGSVRGESPPVTFTLVEPPQAPADRPEVEWIAPSASASLQGTVTLRVRAKGNPSPVVKVFFLLKRGDNLKLLGDGVPKGEDFWDYVWDTQREANGQVQILAVAVNDKGTRGQAALQVTLGNPDRENPSVAWLDPSPGQTLQGVYRLRVKAEDNSGIKRVVFYAGDRQIGEVTASPYEMDWDTGTVPNGPVNLKAVAYDLADNRAEATVQVTVRNGVQADVPVINWSAPSHLAPLQGLVTLRVRATSDPSPVVKVFFLLERDGNLKFIGDGTPAGADFWDYTWDTQGEANGRVKVQAVAVNAKGVQVSAPREVVLNNPDRENPSVVWLNPLPGQNLAGNVVLRVRAEDNMGVDRVAFFAGGRPIGEDSSPPYELEWNTTEVGDGPIDLKAIAFDTANNRAEATVQVVVRNAARPPLLEILSPEGNEPVVGIRFLVRARVLKQDDFTWSQLPKAQVYDYRGNRVAEISLLVNGANPPNNQDSLLEGEIDLGNVPADTYRLVVEGKVVVQGNEYRLYAERIIQVRVDSNLPPALVLYQPFSPGVQPQIKGPFLYLMGEVTDDSGRVHALEVRLIEGGCTNPGARNYLLRYEANPYGLFYFGVPLDGQPYIPNGLYCLRAVAIDAQDQTLRNVQELGIQVNRDMDLPPRPDLRLDPVPGGANSPVDPVSATWTVDFRGTVVTYSLFLRKDGRPVAYLPGQGSSVSISRSFGEGDVGVWDVVVVYQTSDGRQGQAEGGSVAVRRVQQ